MTDRGIPCVLMRGGTSKGPVFLADDLPTDADTRDRVLLRAMGSPDERQIDGLGGATSVTSKVAIVSRSDVPGVDVDYLFAQVDLTRRLVDTGPTCGNMLAAVGPFAVERGLCRATDPTTRIVIRNVNTGSVIDATVETPSGYVAYEGDQAIDGVPGTAAPVELMFRDIVGSKTGSMFPTGSPRDVVDGVEVTCVDVATPVVIAAAAEFGKTGYELPGEIDDDRSFFARVEAIRCKAGQLMGLGDVSAGVLPKFAMVSQPRATGRLTSRYLTPWQCHPTFAVSGAICVSVASIVTETVAADAVAGSTSDLAAGEAINVELEHPSGSLDVSVDAITTDDGIDVRSAGVVRTARKLMAGDVYVPDDVWPCS